MVARSLLVLAFLLATIAARLPMAAARADTWAPYEVHSGTIAQALLDGLDVSIQRLPIQAHIRGSAFMGYALVPIYALFGVSSFAMKLAPLLWHALTVALLVYALDRFASRRAALTAGLLMLFAPPMFAKLSVLGYSSHMESSLPFVLALIPFGALLVERRREVWRYALFGLTVGLAHTWHVQALLPCAVLAGFVVLHENKRLLGARGLALAAGVALGAWPSFYFLGLGKMEGTFDVMKMFLVADHAPESVTRASNLALGDQTSALPKLWALVSGGFVWTLEFFESGPRLGVLLGWGYAVLLVVAGACALWGERARLRLRALFGRDDEPSTLTAPLALHAVGLVLALLVSAATVLATSLTSGFPNRRLAPLLFSMLVLAALGLAGTRRRPTPRALWLGALLPMCLAGAWGQVASMQTSEASRLQVRGECYEWFTRHLLHHSGGTPAGFLETIHQIDRGDARFRPLRYRVAFAPVDVSAPKQVLEGLRTSVLVSREQGVYRAVDIGRQLGEKLGNLWKPTTWKAVELAPGLFAQAMLHGLGQSIPRARPDFPEKWDEFLSRLSYAFESMPPQNVVAVAEGHGFAYGFTLDPYLDSHYEGLVGYGVLPEAARAAFYRGVGWGMRQRYLVPPERMPDGLLALEFLPDGMRAPFEEGFLLTRLPLETPLLERG